MGVGRHTHTLEIVLPRMDTLSFTYTASLVFFHTSSCKTPWKPSTHTNRQPMRHEYSFSCVLVVVMHIYLHSQRFLADTSKYASIFVATLPPIINPSQKFVKPHTIKTAIELAIFASPHLNTLV